MNYSGTGMLFASLERRNHMPAVKVEIKAAANGGNKAANNSGGIITLVETVMEKP
jgi:hypothetical protein